MHIATPGEGFRVTQPVKAAPIALLVERLEALAEDDAEAISEIFRAQQLEAFRGDSLFKAFDSLVSNIRPLKERAVASALINVVGGVGDEFPTSSPAFEAIVEPLRRRFGSFARRLVALGDSGPRDWYACSIEGIRRGSKRPRIQFDIIRNDDSLFELEMTFSSTIALAERLVQAVELTIERPSGDDEECQEAIDDLERALTSLRAALERASESRDL